MCSQKDHQEAETNVDHYVDILEEGIEASHLLLGSGLDLVIFEIGDQTHIVFFVFCTEEVQNHYNHFAYDEENLQGIAFATSFSVSCHLCVFL